VTVASLVTSGSTAQLTYHLGLAKQNGATETELIEADHAPGVQARHRRAVQGRRDGGRIGLRGTAMRGAVIYGPGDVRVEERPDPKIINPTDAVIRLSATSVCGSDLWDWRGINPVTQPTPMGHEYAGVIEETGRDVTTVKPGQFVIGSFFASDNTCPVCQAGYQASCIHREFVGANGAQAEMLRVPLADGTLVATPGLPDEAQVPSFLAASDVLGTGWFGAVAADVQPGKTVAVVGDGAVGLLAVLAARHLGAERIIAMSRHEPRQKLALSFGATDVVTERGDDGVAAIKDLTRGLGAHSVIEAVGTQESMMQAIRSTRPGGHVGYVGVAHGVTLPGEELFYSHVHLHGGPAPVRRFLPGLIDLIANRQIDRGRVFDLDLPLSEAAEGYRAMDERRAIKTLLRP
jgi:threonine dehydrogenase-like Zn-dependent dehydrogenase